MRKDCETVPLIRRLGCPLLGRPQDKTYNHRRRPAAPSSTAVNGDDSSDPMPRLGCNAATGWSTFDGAVARASDPPCIAHAGVSSDESHDYGGCHQSDTTVLVASDERTALMRVVSNTDSSSSSSSTTLLLPTVADSQTWFSGYLTDDSSCFATSPAIDDASSQFHLKYRPTKVLGKGAYSEVVLVVSRRQDALGRVQAYACKELLICPDGSLPRKGETTRTDAEQELDMLQQSRHPNVVRLHEVIWEQDKCRILTQVLKGGDLLDALHMRGSLTEDDTRMVMASLLKALRHMHSKRICHRDVKLENLMLEKFDDFSSAKLVDFGLATKIGFGCLLKPAGTPLFTAPEVLSCVDMEHCLSMYGVECDLWSCGVVMYSLLAGAPPFSGATPTALFSNIRHGNYDFRDPVWELISAEAKDLVCRLLQVSPASRITAGEALEHPWMRY